MWSPFGVPDRISRKCFFTCRVVPIFDWCSPTCFVCSLCNVIWELVGVVVAEKKFVYFCINIVGTVYVFVHVKAEWMI